MSENWHFAASKSRNPSIDPYQVIPIEDIETPVDIYLLHRGPDTKEHVIKVLCFALDTLGVRCFSDTSDTEYSMPLGAENTASMQKGLSGCLFALLVLSDNFESSKHCIKEENTILLREEIERREILIPVYYNIAHGDPRFVHYKNRSSIVHQSVTDRDFAVNVALAILRKVRVVPTPLTEVYRAFALYDEREMPVAKRILQPSGFVLSWRRINNRRSIIMLSRTRLLILFTLIPVVIWAVVALFFVAYQANMVDMSSNVVKSQTQRCNPAITSSETNDRAKEITELVNGYSLLEERIRYPVSECQATPETKALAWLIESDMKQAYLHGGIFEYEERYALVAFWFASEPRLATNWLTPVDHCRWDGVSCGGPVYQSVLMNRHVSQIVLHDHGLHGKLPRDLGILSKLENLDVSKNYIVGEIPTELGRLTKLRFLNLSDNKLEGKLPTELSALDSISVFWSFGNNGLHGETPKSWCSRGPQGQPWGPVIPDDRIYMKGYFGWGLVSLKADCRLVLCTCCTCCEEEECESFNIQQALTSSTAAMHLMNVSHYVSNAEDPYLFNRFNFENMDVSVEAAARAWIILEDSARFPYHGLQQIQQRYALASLGLERRPYKPYHGGGWLSHHDHECDWNWNPMFGTRSGLVACNEDRQVEELTIQYTEDFYFSSDVALLSSLTSLTVSLYQGSFRVPSSLVHLNQLKRLYIGIPYSSRYKSHSGGNQITTENQFPTSLESLVCVQCALSGALSETISNLHELTGLDLHQNSLTGNFDTVSLPSGLRYMTLEDNRLAGSLATELHGLEHLTSISLSSNQMTGTLPSQLGTMWPNLTSLILRNNSFVGSIPETLTALTNLVHLDVSDTRLSGTLPFCALGASDYKSLEKVSLDESRIECPCCDVINKKPRTKS